jgi:hypothetical protein
MSLLQYLQTDQYFSDTWDNTGDQALAIINTAGIPRELLSKLNAMVRITVAEWCNIHWLHYFFIDEAQATEEYPEVLITSDMLRTFVYRADDVIDHPDLMSDVFPYPLWYKEMYPHRATYDDDDYQMLYSTRNRLNDVRTQLKDVDFIYRFCV